MIQKDKLETKPLYSKWNTEWDQRNIEYGDLNGDSINMHCKKCDCHQTFNCKDFIFNGQTLTGYTFSHVFKEAKKVNGTLYLKYVCAHCDTFVRDFLLKIQGGDKIEKIGQYPPSDIDIPKEIKSLGKADIEEIYKKGRILENQGYGIGAFAYYRRIVELCIDDLINEIGSIIPPEDKDKYDKIIKGLKGEKTAQKRIDLIKDTVVDTAIDGNPLSKLYQVSSIGIHGLSDEKCLEYADSLRTLLLYVIEEISREKNKKDGLTKAVGKLDKLIFDSTKE